MVAKSEALNPFRLSCLQNFEDEFLFVILPCRIKMTMQFHKLSSLQHFGMACAQYLSPVIFSSSSTLISLFFLYLGKLIEILFYTITISTWLHTYTDLSTYAFWYWSTILCSWRMSCLSSALWEANQTCRAKVATPGFANLPEQIHLKIR